MFYLENTHRNMDSLASKISVSRANDGLTWNESTESMKTDLWHIKFSFQNIMLRWWLMLVTMSDAVIPGIP